MPLIKNQLFYCFILWFYLFFFPVDEAFIQLAVLPPAVGRVFKEPRSVPVPGRRDRLPGRFVHGRNVIPVHGRPRDIVAGSPVRHVPDRLVPAACLEPEPRRLDAGDPVVELEVALGVPGDGREPVRGVDPELAERVGELESGVLEEPSGWPPSMLGLWYGGSGQADKRGGMFFNLRPVSELPHTLELDEGLGWIGVKARTADGDLTFPVGTGPFTL